MLTITVKVCHTCTVESEVVKSNDNGDVVNDDVSVTSADPSPSSSTVAVTEVGNTADSLVVESCLLQCSVASSASLDVELCRSGAADSLSSASVATKVAEMCPEPLLTFSESSTNLSQCCGETSVDRESPFDSQKWTDVAFSNCRNTSSSSLTELSDSRQFKTGTAVSMSRKRKHDNEVPECGRLMFDKLPNYYTALSIPAKVTAGSAARSSSDLIKDFMCNERDPSPERKSCSVYDKLPAYYSSFTNSTRYDDHEQLSLGALETNFFQDETDAEARYGRSSSSENYELREFRIVDESLVEGSCADDDHKKEKETSTENVSYFVFVVFLCIYCLMLGMEMV